MTIIRSIVSAVFAACLMFVLPGFASAQDVYEVQTSSNDYVIVGAHSGATMDEVVALARRLSGNAELTSEDVLANLPHARRYICRAQGRQIYFGTDPAYGGRCPEEATRSDGLIAGVRYRIPRVHDVVLPPVTRRTSRPVPTGTPDVRVAELETRLNDVSTERDDFRQRAAESETIVNRANDERDEALEQLEEANEALETVRAELANARTALAARPVTRIVTVTDPAAAAAVTRLEGERDALTGRLTEAEATNARLRQELVDARRGEASLNSPFYGRPLWGAGVFFALIMLALLLLSLWPIRYRILKPHLAHREKLEKQKTELEGEVMQTAAYLRTAESDLKKEVEKTKSLTKRRKRLVGLIVYYRGLRDRMERVMADALTKLAELKGFMDRKDAIAKAHADLAALRDQEEPHVNLEALLQEAMDGREEAEARGDQKAMAEHDELIKIYGENLEGLGSPNELRAEIAGLVALLAREMQLQCGIAFDTRSADERLGEWENRKRDEIRKLRAKTQTQEGLTVEVMKAEKVRATEFAEMKRELESAYALKEGTVAGARWMYLMAHYDDEQTIKRNEQVVMRLREEKQRLVDRNGILEQAFIAQQEMEESIEDEIPVNGTPAMGVDRPIRLRKATGSMTQIPGAPPVPTPKQATPAFHDSVYRILNDAEARPDASRIILCDEREGRDLLVLLDTYLVQSPLYGKPVELRKFAATIEKKDPSLLKTRLRRKTDPPGAPAPGQ